MKRRRKHKRFSDAQVVAVILRFLQGESRPELAEDFGLNLETVRDWCDGTTRHRCLIEAEKLYRKDRNMELNKCAVCKCDPTLEVKSADWRSQHPTEDCVFINCGSNCLGGFKGTNVANIVEEWNETQRVLMEREADEQD